MTGVIVGDGEGRESVEALAAKLGADERVLIEGWHDDARSYLPTFDVYCLPSRFEGFPLAVVEAMLAGLPIVAADVGSVSEAIRDGETGLLVPPEDPVALASAIRRLLEDRRLAARLGERARALATEQFTAEHMARAYEDLYRRFSAVSRARPGGGTARREAPSPAAASTATRTRPCRLLRVRDVRSRR